MRLGGAARAPSRRMTGSAAPAEADWFKPHKRNGAILQTRLSTVIFNDNRWHKKVCRCEDFPNGRRKLVRLGGAARAPSRPMTGSAAPAEADWFKPHKRNGAILPTQASTVIFNDSKWHKRFAGGVSRWRQCDL